MNIEEPILTKQKKPRKPRKPRQKKTKVEEPKVEEPKVEEPKVEEPKVEEPKVEEMKVEEPVEEMKVEEPAKNISKSDMMMKDVDETFNILLLDIKELVKDTRNKTSQIKTLHNKVNKTFKILRKEKRNKRDQNNKPSGFNQPIHISHELAKFLELEEDIIARTTATKLVHNYIKKNELKDTTDGRIINPDDNLRNLLKLKSEEELTFFNIQKYLNIHFT